MAENTPQLPEGFTLDINQETPPLPEGFTIDQPTEPAEAIKNQEGSFFDGVNPMTDISLFGVSAQDVVDTGNLAQNIATGMVAKPVAGGAAIKDVLQGEGVQGAETVKEITSQIQTPLSEGGQRIASKIGEAIEGLEENPGFKGIVDLLKSAQSSFTEMMQDSSASAIDPFGVAANKINPEKFPLSERTKTASNIGGALGEAIPKTILEVAGFKGMTSVTPSIKAAVKSGKVSSNAIAKAIAEAAPSVKQLKTRASDVYNKIDELGAVVNKESVQKLFSEAKAKLTKSGLDKDITPKAQAALNRLESEMTGPLTIGKIDTLRKVASTAAQSIEKTDQALGSKLVKIYDNFLDNLSPAQLSAGNAKELGPLFKNARDLWGRARRSELIGEAFNKADLQGSGFENGLRVQFRSILNNNKKRSGFSKDELAAMKKVVQGGGLENTLKFLGKFGITEGQRTNAIGAILGAGAGGAYAGGVGAVAVPLIGTVSMRLSQRLTKGNAEFADAIVRAGRSGDAIAKAYLRSTPKAQQSSGELAELLMSAGADTPKLLKNQLVKDAAYAAQTFSPDQLAAILGISSKDALSNQDQEEEAQK